MADTAFRMVSGDLCSFVPGTRGAFVEHYRCDEYADGTITSTIDGTVTQEAKPGALKGFSR